MAPRISRYWSNWKVSSPITLLNHPLRQIFWHKTHIPPQLGSHCIGLATLFLGTCQFLGTTMLFFRKFMMRATFYIFIICPYDVSEKSYSHLKPRFKTWKKADFAFSKNLNLTPPHFGTNSKVFKGCFFFKPWIYTQIDLGERELFSATMRRSDMIRRALDAPMSVDYSTYLQHVLMTHEKFSRGLQSRRSH